MLVIPHRILLRIRKKSSKTSRLLPVGAPGEMEGMRVSSWQETEAWLSGGIDGRVAVASHRGKFSSSVIENTALACLLALDEGADLVELDVSRTKDGVLVGHHDKTMNRLFHLDRPLAGCTWEELRGLPLYNYVGEIGTEGLDTLPHILDSLKDRAFVALDRCWDCWEEVHALVREKGMAGQALFKFYIENETACRFAEDHPNALYVPMVKDPATLDRVEALGRTVRIPALEILPEAPDDPIFQPEIFHRLHSRNIKVWCNSLSLAKRLVYGGGYDDLAALRLGGDKSWGVLAAKGVDIIQTDWPWEAKRYLASIGRSLP